MTRINNLEVMSRTKCLYGGPVYTGSELIEMGAVVFSEEAVLDVVTDNNFPGNLECIDVRGQLIAPGLVDLHSDALEKYVEVRPGIFFDSELAMINMDRRAAASGITTFCHAISFAGDELGLRSGEQAERLVRLIETFDASPQASIRHRAHARCEVGAENASTIIGNLIEDGLVDVLSIMDHTPGQGQFKTYQSFIDYYQKTYRFDSDHLFQIIDRKKQIQQDAWHQVTDLMKKALQNNIPLLSHDDDTVEKVNLVNNFGARGSEFPVSMKAAKAARNKGMKVFMGAPNVVRGKSTNNHLRALDAVADNLCDGLISDYYPECLLQAPFVAQKNAGVNFSNSLALVTSQPGDFLKHGSMLGQITKGIPADIIVVDTKAAWKTVSQTWVNGRCVYRSHRKTDYRN